MPIMNELRSINVLEKAGFTHDQAKAVVEIVEEGLQGGFEQFVEVLDRRLSEMEARLKVEFQNLRLEMHDMRAELMKEQRDLVWKLTAVVSLIVAAVGVVLRFV